MKIIYALTLMENENDKILLKNLKHLDFLNINYFLIVNTNKKNLKLNIKNCKVINKVEDMKNSRINLHKECSKYEAESYWIFDSDIDFINLEKKDFDKVFEYQKTYDFISLYYKIDPPIPIFFTLASSLKDFYSCKKNLKGINKAWFDDSNFETSKYQESVEFNNQKDLSEILKGKSFARDTDNFISTINEHDTTTGGASIYFNKTILEKEFDWTTYNSKSLTWYDSYKTNQLSKKFKFAKVPIFVNHIRHDKNNTLNWESVLRYAIGLNLYMQSKESNWNKEKIILQIEELYFYQKGMIKKLELLNLNLEETKTINKIKTFLNIDIFSILERIRKWKSE